MFRMAACWGLLCRVGPGPDQHYQTCTKDKHTKKDQVLEDQPGWRLVKTWLANFSPAQIIFIALIGLFFTPAIAVNLISHSLASDIMIAMNCRPNDNVLSHIIATNPVINSCN